MGYSTRTGDGPGLSRRRFLVAGGMTTAGVLLGACGRDSEDGAAGVRTPAAGTPPPATTTPADASPTPAAPAAGSEVISSLELGINNPNYATQLPIFIAAAKGYFEEVGISDFEAIATDEYIPGLIGGSLHFTQGDTDVLLGSAFESGEPIRYMGTYRHKEYRILAAGPGIETFEDLRGKTLTGGPTGSRNEFLMKQILRENGLDPEEDVEFVPLGGGSDARLQALINGQVQGASIFPRHVPALEREGGKVLYEEFFEVPQEGVAAMQPFLEENHPTAVAYWTATLRARQWMYDEANKDEAIQIMRDAGFEIPEDFVSVFELEVEQISPDGGFEAEDMDALVADQQELGLLPEGLEWRDHISLDALWEAQEALGLPQRPDPATI